MRADETDVMEIMRAATVQLAGLGSRPADARARGAEAGRRPWRSAGIATADLLLAAALVVVIVVKGASASTSCPTLRYSFDRASTPQNIAVDIDAAFAAMASATGMTAVHGPSGDGVAVSFAPLGIDDAGRQLAGEAWPVLHDTTAAPTGVIVLDAEARLPAGTGERRSWRGLVMHEVGHLVGLEHSESVHDVMYPTINLGNAQWSESERARLAEIGRELGCRGR